MNTRTPLITSALLAVSLISGAAHAALQGRDLNGSIDSFEAYYDTGLNITWLADANYAKTSGYAPAESIVGGLMTRAEATTWAANLSFNDGANIYDNWRLPTVKPVNNTSFNYSFATDGSTDDGLNITSPNSEMAYMFYVNLGNLGYYTPAGAVSGCNTSYIGNTCLVNVGPFANLQPYKYWSGTQYSTSDYLMWRFNMGNGSQDPAGDYSSIGVFAWAVSPGDVGIAAVPEADTWAMLLAGLGLVGAAARRRKLAKV